MVDCIQKMDLLCVYDILNWMRQAKGGSYRRYVLIL